MKTLRYTCTMDGGCLPECCAQWRAGGWCANTGGDCAFREPSDGTGACQSMLSVSDCVTTLGEARGVISRLTRQRDGLRSCLELIRDHGGQGMTDEGVSRHGGWCAEQARAALAESEVRR